MSSESGASASSVAAERPAVPPAPTGSSSASPPPAAPPSAAAPPPPVVDTPPSEADITSGAANPYGLPEIAVQRPEVAAGAAFAGGLVLAQILKRLAR